MRLHSKLQLFCFKIVNINSKMNSIVLNEKTVEQDSLLDFEILKTQKIVENVLFANADKPCLEEIKRYENALKVKILSFIICLFKERHN
jgi:hypothetical protein